MEQEILSRSQLILCNRHSEEVITIEMYMAMNEGFNVSCIRLTSRICRLLKRVQDHYLFLEERMHKKLSKGWPPLKNLTSCHFEFNKKISVRFKGFLGLFFELYRFWGDKTDKFDFACSKSEFDVKFSDLQTDLWQGNEISGAELTPYY